MYYNYEAEDLIARVETEIKYGIIKSPMMEQNKVLIILSGIQCSGKSTWIKNSAEALIAKYNAPLVVISRDVIRGELFGGQYKQNSKDEQAVTKEFYKVLSHALYLDEVVIVLDNCHVQEKDIQGYIQMLKPQLESGKFKLYVKVMEVPLWKALIRNVIRYFNTNKWIPIKVIKDFHKRNQKFNKSHIKEYLYE